MSMTIDNQTWLIEAGDAIIKKEMRLGAASLTAIERLIHCLWVADYGMRNAGDLATAADVYPPFHKEALALAKSLALSATADAFSLPLDAFESSYYERFDSICDEIRTSETST